MFTEMLLFLHNGSVSDFLNSGFGGLDCFSTLAMTLSFLLYQAADSSELWWYDFVCCPLLYA